MSVAAPNHVITNSQVQADNASLKGKLRVAEEEIAKRALASLETGAGRAGGDDSSAVMHLRAENARLRAQLKYAWKQVAEVGRKERVGMRLRVRAVCGCKDECTW